MGGVSGLRTTLGGLGVLVGLYGAYLVLSRQDFSQLVSVAIWVGGGLVVHDGLIALLTIAAVVLGARVLPAAAQWSAAVVLVVLGPATILAIPMLGRFGAKSDNATLLDRHYWLGWSAMVLLVVVAVVVASVVRSRRAEASVDAQDAQDAPG